MTEREQALMAAIIDRLGPLEAQLRAAGWAPELIAFAPTEIPRIPGYKVAIVVPLDPAGEAPT